MVDISGASCNVTGIGDLPVIARDHMGKLVRLIIRGVRCVPTFTETLLSVDQFYEKSGVEVRFAGHNHVHLPAKNFSWPVGCVHALLSPAAQRPLLSNGQAP